MIRLILCILIISAVGNNAEGIQAAKPLDGSQEIKKRKETINTINNKLEEHVKKKEKEEKKEKSIISELERIEKTIDSLENDIKLYDNKLKKTAKEISVTQVELNDAVIRLIEIQIRLQKRVRTIYKQGRVSFSELLLTSKNFSDFVDKFEYMKGIAENDRILKNMVEVEKNKIEDKKRLLEEKKKMYSGIKKSTEIKRNELIVEKKKRKDLLVKVRKQKTLYEKAIAELQEARHQLQELLNKLERKAKLAEDIGRLDKLNFANNKGRLPWPVEGRVLTKFGNYKHPKFNAVIFNSGIEIKANLGEPVISVASGVVIYADWFKGFGKMIIIDNGGGFYTVYGHLSAIDVATEDKIKIGSVIGKVGDTGSLGGSSLYFEIRRSGKSIDPLEWLIEK